MKKKLFRVACVAAVLTMALSFAGCGKKEESGSGSGSKTESNVDNKGGNEFDTVEDYVNSSELQSQLSTLKSNVQGSGLNIDIKAEDNVLIYEYKYDDLKKADVTDEAIATLESGLEQQSATFETVADSLKSATNEKNPVVKIVYLSSDGEVIVEKEFTSK